MTSRTYPRIAAAIGLIFSFIFAATALAVPVQELVSPFSLPVSSPTRGGLTPGPDGWYWGTTHGGGPAGDGAIYRMKPDGTWQTMLSFTNSAAQNRGRTPGGGLSSDGQGYLWGTTSAGGEYGFGTIYKYHVATGVLTTLHHCRNAAPNRGLNPGAGLVNDGRGFMWGTMPYGANADNGCIFKIGIANGIYTQVAEFSGTAGAVKGTNPAAKLASDGGDFLWGSTQLGGAPDSGTIFKVNILTGVVTTVVEFNRVAAPAQGSYPSAELCWDGAGNFWGTTANGGTPGHGTIFKVNAASGTLTTIAAFTGTSGAFRGSSPSTGLTADHQGILWGSTSRGGVFADRGTIYRVDPQTGAASMVLAFPEVEGTIIGRYPTGKMLHLGAGVLLGTTSAGGGGDPDSAGPGTIFKYDTTTATFTNLVQFTEAGSVDVGRTPYAGLVEGNGGLLWGSTREGGLRGYGTIFKVDPLSGERITVLQFTGGNGSAPGKYPLSTLVRDGSGNLWGTTYMGGTNDFGTLFKIREDTGTLTTVFQFGTAAISPGYYPQGLMMDAEGTLWGTLSGGGVGHGGIYRANATTGAMTGVLNFTKNGADNKGSGPVGALHDDGVGYLWGTTYSGGGSDFGTVFKLEKSTSRLTTLLSFTGGTGNFPGANPTGKLVDDGAGNLWGMSSGGNVSFTSSVGTLFKISKATGAFTNVVGFTGNGASNKGGSPFGGLTPDGQGFLWGATYGGGNNGRGTVFKVNIASGVLTTLLQLDAAGINPYYVTLLKHTDGNFYGTASTGGPNWAGSIFRVRLGPTPVTLPTTGLSSSGGTINGTVSPNGTATAVTFEYGTQPDLTGSTVVQVASGASGSNPISYSRAINGLSPKTTYYYRISGTNPENPVAQRGRILSFRTPGNDATLASLTLDPGSLTPSFQSSFRSYLVTLPSASGTASLMATPSDEAATIRINGTPLAPGSPFILQPALGNTLVNLAVTAEDGVTVSSYKLSVTRLPTEFQLGEENIAPLSTEGLAANGHEIPLDLRHAPLPGRTLKVVENTSTDFIEGRFSNLAQGQEVVLTYQGKTYRFIANYYGGSGNDLVLHWAQTALASWGKNDYGQLGNGLNDDVLMPARPTEAGVLAGKTLFSVAAGMQHCLALSSDGTVATWGDGFMGKIGDGEALPRAFPVAVDRGGVLAGKTVVAVAAGWDHSLVLCSDGTMATWGANGYGQLGHGIPGSYSTRPVAVSTAGVLAGRRVVAIATAEYQCLALCSDGTLVQWGQTEAGNLHEPAEFPRTGALAGKQVIAISMGGGQKFARCSDGSIAAWGYNAFGQLGDNSSTTRTVPVAVLKAGALAGRTPVSVKGGYVHSMALCSDGALVAWGANGAGLLGDGTATPNPPYSKLVPVMVTATGVLAGKQVIDFQCGDSHNLALCSDGTLVSWGQNADGQLGTNTTAPSLVPVRVGTTNLPSGSRIVSAVTGPRSHYNLAIISLSAPEVITSPANLVRSHSAQLRGLVRPVGQDTSAFFEWGTSTDYGTTVPVDGGIIPGTTSEKMVFHSLADLQPATTYHFRLWAENESGRTYGQAMSFRTPNNNPYAASIATGSALTPAFDRNGTRFSLTVPYTVDELPVTVIAEDPAAEITIQGIHPGADGTVNVNLPPGSLAIRVDLVAENQSDTKSYWIDVVRLPETIIYETGTEIGASAERFALPDVPVNIELRYAPEPGTGLMVARSTGLEFPLGRFSNLAHGQAIVLTHASKSYRFIANYYGGSGNDLVLEWADTAVYGWGANGNGQLGAGDGTPAPRLLPMPVTGGNPDALATFATAAGYMHSLALASDGTVRAWGSNTFGQLGDGTKTSRDTPAPVLAGGALAGKTVVSIAAGAFHSLALCSDGTVAAWGYNNHGQLGNGSTTLATTPVAVDASGVLAGRKVVAISAGAYHSLALCADGSVAAWGFNGTGALGDGTTLNRTAPVMVITTDGELLTAGAISAGQYHNLAAILSNGRVVAWGYNHRGQLGDGTTEQRSRATPVATAGVLNGQSAYLLAAGASHSAVVLNIGTMAAWGEGSSGQLGNGSNASSLLPVAVSRPGVLSGLTIETLVAGADHTLAQTNGGTMVSWGSNPQGQLGNGGTQQASIPQAVSQQMVEAGARFATPAKGSSATHAITIVARQPAAGNGTPPPAPTLGGTGGSGGEAAGASSLAAWRARHFGNPEQAAAGGDDADPDHDGMVNLIEYAFAMDPAASDASLLPKAVVKDGHLVFEFTAPADDMGVTYGASWTSDPAQESWQELTDEGEGRHHLFRIPIGDAKRFMRLEVTPRQGTLSKE